jgi:hypothetical protein
VEQLSEHGWTTSEVTTKQLAERYGRDLSDPFSRRSPLPWLDTGFVTGELARD